MADLNLLRPSISEAEHRENLRWLLNRQTNADRCQRMDQYPSRPPNFVFQGSFNQQGANPITQGVGPSILDHNPVLDVIFNGVSFVWKKMFRRSKGK